MTTTVPSTRPRSRGRKWSAGAIVWLVWMEAMWAAFFVLLATDQLESLWNSIRDLPMVAEIVIWIACFPWMLGTAVWTSSWSEAIRILLVACFAIAWSLLSIPRRQEGKS